MFPSSRSVLADLEGNTRTKPGAPCAPSISQPGWQSLLGRLAALLKLGGELAVITDRQPTQAAHDLLARGQPVKRFKGPGFVPN